MLTVRIVRLFRNYVSIVRRRRVNVLIRFWFRLIRRRIGCETVGVRRPLFRFRGTSRLVIARIRRRIRRMRSSLRVKILSTRSLKW